jgi:flagellar biosynthesis protein FlhF
MEIVPTPDLQAPVKIHALRGAGKTGTLAQIGERAELLALLRHHRVPESIAHDLAKNAAQSGLDHMTLALACALDRRMKSMPIDLAASKALLLVGSYGAGKTAVAAKLATLARLEGRPARLFAFHTIQAGSAARLEALSRHIDVPFAVIESAQTLNATVAACVKKDWLAIVDTAGFDPRSERARAAFSALAGIEYVEAVGIVSANGDAEETCDLVAALSSLGARRLIVTGVDLAVRLGGLVAASSSGLPLAHLSCSAHAAAGLENATPLSLARALVGSCADPDAGFAQ